MRIPALFGPTAVGKTEAALLLAPPPCVLVNADSRQLVKGLRIGTAAPTEAERSAGDWRLFEIADPSGDFSAKAYLEAVEGILEEKGERPALLVGGSPFYLRVLEDGFFESPATPEEVRSRVAAWEREGGAPLLATELLARDPAYHAEVDLRNVARLRRALESILTTGRPFSESRGERKGTGHALLGISLFRRRRSLYDRIDRRVAALFDAGWEDEVRGLLAAGVDFARPALNGIGYREVASVVEGTLSREEATTLIRASTRQFARRQIHWFKRFERTLHVEMESDAAPFVEEDRWFEDLPEWDPSMPWPEGRARARWSPELAERIAWMIRETGTEQEKRDGER